MLQRVLDAQLGDIFEVTRNEINSWKIEWRTVLRYGEIDVQPKKWLARLRPLGSQDKLYKLENSGWLVCGCLDRLSRALPLTCPNVENLEKIKRNARKDEEKRNFLKNVENEKMKRKKKQKNEKIETMNKIEEIQKSKKLKKSP